MADINPENTDTPEDKNTKSVEDERTCTLEDEKMGQQHVEQTSLINWDLKPVGTVYPFETPVVC